MQSRELKGHAWSVWSIARKFIVRMLVAAITLLGLGVMGSSVESWRVANERARPLGPLTQAIDLSASYEDGPPYAVEDGTLVHVEGVLRAEPPLRASGAARGGRGYALQQLRVEQGRWSHVFRVTNRRRLWLYVDRDAEPGAVGRVEVLLPPLWTGDELSAGSKRGVVGVAGTIPNNVAVALSPDLPPPAPEVGEQWTLWAIGQGERVTVVSRARHQEGRIVLSSERGQSCIVSQRPWPSLMGSANLLAAEQFVLGVLCLSPLGWKGWKWARKRAAST